MAEPQVQYPVEDGEVPPPNGDEHPALAQAEPQPEPPNIEQALPLPLDGELQVIWVCFG